jgi:hypothetical protein
MDTEFGRMADRARATLGLEEGVPARHWDVWRPVGSVVSHLLVEFGDPSAAIAVAAVDSTNGDVLSSARLPGQAPHIGVDEATALIAAGRPGGRARLVWSPSRQSASPLYPLWEVRSASNSGEPVYVDLAARVWPALEPGGPGG